MGYLHVSRRSVLAGGLGTVGLAVLPGTARAAVTESRTSAPRDSAAVRLVLPGPSGPAPVGTTTLHLVDTSRRDPWRPDTGPRHLMVNLTYPAGATAGHGLAPWLAPGASAAFMTRNGIPEGLAELPTTHSVSDAPLARWARRLPVVVYSPGLASDRAFNTVTVEELASYGYLVATVDHPYDSGEVEFPDGRVVGTLPEVEDAREQGVAIRAADAGPCRTVCAARSTSTASARSATRAEQPRRAR